MQKPRTSFSHTGKLEIFPMDAAWRYITIPESKVPNVPRRGWGSVKLEVTVGGSTWQTSMFPYKGNYFIPIKQSVCKKEKLEVGKKFHVSYTAVGA